MTIDTVVQNPFAVITIIAAPAILTNASSILTLSTSTRLMRCLDRINTLTGHLDRHEISKELRAVYLEQTELSHRQARQFLGALRWIYVALGAFAIASFLALMGASTVTLLPGKILEALGALSLIAGGVGALGFLWSSVNLISASRIIVQILQTDNEILKALHRK
jgi:hypothetical protein